MTLSLVGLTKRFGDIEAVSDVSLELPEGETLALLGPSGCGKSTLLRLVAGLEQPDSGRVRDGSRDLTHLPPQKRGVGVVFQDFALFPHLDVAGNVAFGPVEMGSSSDEASRRTAELLDLVGLEGFEKRRVYELSGGQQQRVALARALAPRPSLLLLDEPLSNLDAELRGSLQRELRSLLADVGVKAIYVTHDQSEAFAVADRVALMRAGRIVQVGPSDTLLDEPRNAWAARFLGYRNIYGGNELTFSRRPGSRLLLKEELVRSGGNTTAELLAIEPVDHRLRLLLRVPSWGVDMEWVGYRRELPTGLRVGDRVGLDVPEAAWVELEDS